MSDLRGKSLGDLADLFLRATVGIWGTDEEAVDSVLRELHDRDAGAGDDLPLDAQRHEARDKFEQLIRLKMGARGDDAGLAALREEMIERGQDDFATFRRWPAVHSILYDEVLRRQEAGRAHLRFAAALYREEGEYGEAMNLYIKSARAGAEREGEGDYKLALNVYVAAQRAGLLTPNMEAVLLANYRALHGRDMPQAPEMRQERREASSPSDVDAGEAAAKRAVAAAKGKMWRKAIAAYEEALDDLELADINPLDDRFAVIHESLGFLHMKPGVGEYDNAVGHYLEAAEMYERTDRMDRAARLYVTAAGYANLIRDARMKVKCLEAAAYALERLSRIPGRDSDIAMLKRMARIHGGLAGLHKRAGNVELEARQRESSAQALERLARLHEQAGRLAEAAAAYLALASALPKGEREIGLRQAAAGAYVRMGRVDDAVAVHLKILGSADNARSWDELKGIAASLVQERRFVPALRIYLDMLVARRMAFREIAAEMDGLFATAGGDRETAASEDFRRMAAEAHEQLARNCGHHLSRDFKDDDLLAGFLRHVESAARLSEGLGQYGRAARLYFRIRESNFPEHHVDLVTRIRFCEEGIRLADEAVRLGENQLMLAPWIAAAHEDLGWIFYFREADERLGAIEPDPAAAIRHYELAAEMRQSTHDWLSAAQDHLDAGINAYYANDVRGAQGHFDSALSIISRHGVAGDRWGGLQSEAQRWLDHLRTAH